MIPVDIFSYSVGRLFPFSVEFVFPLLGGMHFLRTESGVHLSSVP